MSEPDDGALIDRRVWQPGDERKHNPPLTREEVVPNYTLIRIIDPDAAPETLPEGDPGYVGPRPRLWRCSLCGARSGSRTEVGATNALLAHESECPGPSPAPETKDPASCDSSPSTSPSDSSAPSPQTSVSPSPSSPTRPRP